MIKYGYGELIMTEYQAIYKCRLCGEEFEEGTTGDIIAMACTVALTVKDSTEHVRYERNLHRHMPHHCKDGSYGFADFCGFRKVED